MKKKKKKKKLEPANKSTKNLRAGMKMFCRAPFS